MRVPLSWLRDYVEITITPEELAEKLTLGGLEVEQAEYIGISRPQDSQLGESKERPELAWDPAHIVVGEILEVKPHPNADRLTLAIVEYGAERPIQVVTGAPNIKVGESGHKVAFGLEGARLFDGHEPGWKLMTLKMGKIRGIESGCMVLSEKELGISEDHEGIILLPADAPAGMPLVEYLGDIVFEVKINPNMARAASILGVAREVAALTGAKLRPPSTDVVARGPSIKGQVEIVIQEPGLNPRFTAALVRGVEIQPSPFQVQRRLKLAGMRPINNIVDVTNYVMLEVGQPLHAFDYDKLCARAEGRPPTITTRLAEAGEELETLDGVKRKLDPFTILVCDSRGSLSIGGVMGGAESEVDANSHNILLEAAAWDYINIRRTMQAQHLSSEAGYRFSRGVAPSQAVVGLKRAIEMMRELGGGQIARGIVDEYPGKKKPIHITLPLAEVKRQLGVDLTARQITQLLTRLDFDVQRQKKSVLVVTAPDYRLDVDGTDDVIEEIARLYGYHNFPISRMNDELPPQRTNLDLEQEELVRDRLVDAELQEVVSNSLTTPEREVLLTLPGSVHPAIPARRYVRIENPISAERTAMRQTLLANLLDLAAANLRYRARVALFEVGNVYWMPEVDEPLLPRERASRMDQDEGLPVERRRLGIVMTGPRDEPAWTDSGTAPIGLAAQRQLAAQKEVEPKELAPKEPARRMDFFDLKGLVEQLLDALHIPDATYAPSTNPLFHPGRAATVKLDDVAMGTFGELHPLLHDRFDLPVHPVLIGEFDLDLILDRVSSMFSVRPPSRYPAVVQDLAVIVDAGMPAERVLSLIRQTGGELLQRTVLFDLYQGEPVPAGKKSLAYTLTFQSMDRTLSDADASKIRDKIVNRLRHEVGAELRGG